MFSEKFDDSLDIMYPVITADARLPKAHSSMYVPFIMMSCILVPSVWTSLVIVDI